MKQRSIVLIRCLQTTITLVMVGLLVSCDVFMPNFLVGIWVAPGKNGDERLTFTKEGNFTAQFYKKGGSVSKMAGKYKAGKSVVQLNYKTESGGTEKSMAAYKMYSRSMDFMFKGNKTTYYKF